MPSSRINRGNTYIVNTTSLYWIRIPYYQQNHISSIFKHSFSVKAGIVKVMDVIYLYPW